MSKDNIEKEYFEKDDNDDLSCEKLSHIMPEFLNFLT